MSTLHLVGETIDAKTAHLRARDGTIVKVERGVYLNAAAEAESVLRTHAVRIARYLYPAAYLSSASAVLLAPTPDGRLFMHGRRNQHTRIRGLEIVQTEAPPQPSLDRAAIGDSLGEFTIQVSSPEQRLLEAFRVRSEQASATAEYGSGEAAADVLWKLARANDWFREGESAERYLRGGRRAAATPANAAAFSLLVAWHGAILGVLTHDGHEWRWKASRGPNPPLVRETIPGTLPPFIESLLPEGWLARVLHDEDERSALRHGKRYISNITIGVDRAELARLPTDMLEGRLCDFEKDGAFLGAYHGPGRGEINESFEANLARIFASGATPRLSGVQIKAPMYLSRTGELRPANDLPFTHILKPAGTSGFEQMPVVEWLCRELGRLAGFATPAIALVAMPGEMPPALLVERFDIREGPDDARRFVLEDFCSVLGVPSADKYRGTFERVGRALRSLSTDPAGDLSILFARALFAWVVADGDMHLKNLALLKIVRPDARTFESVTMAPLYDSLTTRVFPGLHEDHMALKLAGKDDRLRLRDFEALARTIEIPLGRARDITAQLVSSASAAAEMVRMPALVRGSLKAQATASAVIAIVQARARALQEEVEGASS